MRSAEFLFTCPPDRDGYSPSTGDCDDSDADVGPFAPEQPLNSKDDDCNGRVDDGCNDPSVCNRPPRAPKSVSVLGNVNGSAWCRVSGQAEPLTTISVFDQSGRVQLGTINTSSTGAFSNDFNPCYAGDVLTLYVKDSKGGISATVWARTSGSDSRSPLTPAGLKVSTVDGDSVRLTGDVELGASVRVTNRTSSGAGPVTIAAGSGYGTAFDGRIGARPGDWLALVTVDAAGRTSSEVVVQAPGTDGDAPAAPVGVGALGNVNGSAWCRVSGQAEPNARLTVYDASGRVGVLTNAAVPSTGAFSFDLNPCYAGDALIAWVNDGAGLVSPKVQVRVSGSDSRSPLTPSAPTISAVSSGVTTLSGGAEPDATVHATNTRDGATAQVAAPRTTTANDGAFSFTVAAAPGDWLRLWVKDPAGSTSSELVLQVPGSDGTPPQPIVNLSALGNVNGSAWCRVSGQAEPNVRLGVYDASGRVTLLTNAAVPSTGAFSFDLNPCYAGDTLVAWTTDAAGLSSARQPVRVSGSDSRSPLTPSSPAISGVSGGLTTLSGGAEPDATVLATNTRDGATGSGASVRLASANDGTFSFGVAALPGDWVRLWVRDPAGRTSSELVLQVPGGDATPPQSIVNLSALGNVNGSAWCRVSGQAEPNARLTVYDASGRVGVLTNAAVPSSGAFSFDLNPCYAGDVLVASTTDAAGLGSPRQQVRVSGTDSRSPLAAANITLSGPTAQGVTVSALGEPFGKLWVKNAATGVQVSAATDFEGRATVTIAAFRNDALQIWIEDASARTSSVTTQTVP